MKKSEVLKSFQTFLTQKEKDLDEAKSLYELLRLDVEEVKADYRSNFYEAKEELSKSSNPLDFYQTLSSHFHGYIFELLRAMPSDAEIPDATYVDTFIDLLIGEILKDVEWEDSEC